MRIHEYQAKRLLAGFGVPVPRGEAVTSAAEARAVAEEIGGPVAVKAQVHAGGRGKAGGILKAASPAAARLLDRPLLTAQTGPEGRLVRRVLVEEVLDVARELYVGLTLSREDACFVLPVSPRGGSTSKRSPPANPTSSSGNRSRRPGLNRPRASGLDFSGRNPIITARRASIRQHPLMRPAPALRP